MVCFSLSIVSAERVTIDWDNSYHQTDSANSNTLEASLNSITAGYYSILHNDNDKIHIEFSFNQTVFDVDMLVYVYDHSEDSRISRIMSSSHFDLCTVGVTYTFENSGFPRESQGIYIVFLYRINASQYESGVIKAHNGVSLTGMTNIGTIVFDPVGSTYRIVQSDASTKDILTGNVSITEANNDPLSEKIKSALNEVLEKNPYFALISGMQGIFILIETWNNLFDLFSNPEGRIMEVVLTAFIALGVMLIIYQSKYALGLILIIVCTVPMVGTEKTVLGALIRPLFEETFGKIW